MLSIDTKGVSNLYRFLQHKGNQILEELEVKWDDKAQIKLSSIEIARLFVSTTHHSKMLILNTLNIEHSTIDSIQMKISGTQVFIIRTQ